MADSLDCVLVTLHSKRWTSATQAWQRLPADLNLIAVDVPARSIRLEISDEELARRRAAWTPPPARYERGYGWMFSQHIRQANDGCDFDFLETKFGAPVSEPVIY